MRNFTSLCSLPNAASAKASRQFRHGVGMQKGSGEKDCDHISLSLLNTVESKGIHLFIYLSLIILDLSYTTAVWYLLQSSSGILMDIVDMNLLIAFFPSFPWSRYRRPSTTLIPILLIILLQELTIISSSLSFSLVNSGTLFSVSYHLSSFKGGILDN